MDKCINCQNDKCQIASSPPSSSSNSIPIFQASSRFADQQRLVDFVLVFDLNESNSAKAETLQMINGKGVRHRGAKVNVDNGQSKSSRNVEKRMIYEENLQLLGLELEYVNVR